MVAATPTAGTPRLVADSACLCGEGVLWDPLGARLWWVEMIPPTLFCLDPLTGRHTAQPIAGERVAAAVLRGPSGLVLVGAERLVRLGESGPDDATALGLPLANGPRANLNDAKVHQSGAVVLASADGQESEGLGGFEHLAADLTRTPLADPVVIGNGPAFSRDGRTLYASDTVGRRVLAVPLAADGLPTAPPRPFTTLEPSDGMPDGMTVDAEGALWVAFWGGGQVVRYDPAGAVMQRIALPVRQVTNVAFGGTDLRTLYITTARAGLSEADLQAQPGAGGVFALDLPVQGVAEPVLAIPLP